MFKKGSNRRQSEPSNMGSNRWTAAISRVRKDSVRRTTMADLDPFLERFTVTGRAATDEHEHNFTDVFTLKFWKELVIDPSNSSYYYWSMVITLAVMYNLLFVILRTSFYDLLQIKEKMYIWFIMDYFCDILYAFDMFIKSRIGFLEQGLLVRDTARLRSVYINSWKFKVDILSILPFDLLYLLVGFESLLRLNRCLKVWRMAEYFHLAETHTNFPNMFRVVNLILIIIIIIHWNCCIYFSISRALGFGSDGWVYPDPNTADFGSFWKQYVYSFYWSVLTLTTIGDTPYPEHTLSFIYCICDSLIGVLIFATIFGNVGALINEMDAHRNEFQHKVDAVKRYMEIRQVGGLLQERVVKWFDYTWNNKQSIDDKAALEHLPEKLRAEIAIHVHLQTLRRVGIFQDCEPGLLVELVLKLRLQVFSPGDYICRKGDIGKEMYIVKRGKLQVVSEDGKTVFVTLSDGAVFGEISILNIAGNKTGNRRTASVRSMGYSDLFCLNKNDLWDALQEYPEAKKMLSEKGKQLLRKDNLIDEEAARREERRQQNLDKKIELIADAVDDLQKDINKLIDKISKRSSDKEGRKSQSKDGKTKTDSDTVEQSAQPNAEADEAEKSDKRRTDDDEESTKDTEDKTTRDKEDKQTVQGKTETVNKDETKTEETDTKLQEKEGSKSASSKK